MSQVVQAKCPHCQNILRIPEEWLSRAMRCKHCKKEFQAKAKSAVSYPVGKPATGTKAGAPTPVAKPANPYPVAAPALSAPPASTGMQVAPPVVPPPSPPGNDPFGFADDDAPMPSIESQPRRRKKGGGLLLLLFMFFFLFLLGAGGVGLVAFKIFELPNSLKPGPVANADKADPERDRSTPTPRDGSESNNGDGLKKKKGPIKRDGSKDSSKTDGKKITPSFSNDLFPRRALLINVNNYLMFNTVHYGSPQDASRYPGSSTAVLRERLTRPPMNFPATQVYELSDGIPPEYKATKPHSTQKSVLETTITDFLAASRAQDRILVFFAGHAAHIEDKSYLVPIDGNKNKVESLVPLKWVMDEMAKCKAQQKILILDVFRFSPSRGLELPSAGEGDEGVMPEGFEKDLADPPAGVQVWCSSQKEQNSVELDEGSAFLQALCNSLQGGGKMTGIATPDQPIPLDDIVTDVNQRLKKLLEGEKRTQVSKLTGKPPTGSVAYNSSEALPAALVLKPPTVPGGEAAGAATIERILEELRIMPPVRDTRAGDISLLRAQNLPAFAAKKIDGYKADGYQNITDLQNKFKNNREAFAKEFPLRAAYFEALEELAESKKVEMREVLASPVDPKRKAAFLQEQAPLGISIFKLEGILAIMKDAEEKRESETSKRWQANFDYMRARVYGRIVYLYEYNYILGKIRGDDLPELAPGQTGWRVGVSGSKITVTDQKAKGYAKETQRIWKHIQNEYQDTPWSLLAQRESMFALGLAWRPKSD